MSEISRPIQAIPQGLLGFLQLKNMGKNPSEISDLLQPVMDLREWYLQTAQRNFIGNGGAAPSAALPNNTVGFIGWLATVPNITVPPNEWWYCPYYTALSATLVAGETIQFGVGFRNPDAGFTYQTLIGDPCDPVTGANKRAFAFARDFWVPPGSQLGIQVIQTVTAATITVEGHLRYVPLQI